jgi:hypothetical protein
MRKRERNSMDDMKEAAGRPRDLLDLEELDKGYSPMRV